MTQNAHTLNLYSTCAPLLLLCTVRTPWIGSFSTSNSTSCTTVPLPLYYGKQYVRYLCNKQQGTYLVLVHSTRWLVRLYPTVQYWFLFVAAQTQASTATTKKKE